MKQIVIVVSVCLTVLFTSGCAEKQCPQCQPIVKYVKPKMPSIDKAEIEQCRYSDTLANAKCVLVNYFEVKAERDKLRVALDEICE